jgi:hypothetical protein
VPCEHINLLKKASQSSKKALSSRPRKMRSEAKTELLLLLQEHSATTASDAAFV